MPFTIRDIPAAMRRNGWTVGARLMDRWFTGSARAMSAREKNGDAPSNDIEARMVTMAWALRFDRVRVAQERLLATWSQGSRLTAGSAVIAQRLTAWRSANPPTTGAFRFGNLAAPAQQVDRTCQVNFERIESSLFASIDDFYAGMGNALLKIAVSGMASPIAGNRWRVTIDEVGTYIRDTYDFNGAQSLGNWGPDGISRIAVLAAEIPIIAEEPHGDGRGRYFSVENESFRRYRAHYNRGGDFVILSDIARRRLTAPVIVEVAA